MLGGGKVRREWHKMGWMCSLRYVKVVRIHRNRDINMDVVIKSGEDLIIRCLVLYPKQGAHCKGYLRVRCIWTRHARRKSFQGKGFSMFFI